jgi:hypothetical protein
MICFSTGSAGADLNGAIRVRRRAARDRRDIHEPRDRVFLGLARRRLERRSDAPVLP